MRLEDFVSRLHARRLREGEYRAACPVHGGTSKTSLSIKDAGDRILIHCFAGCDYIAILNAIGVSTPAELFEDEDRRNPETALRRKARTGLCNWCERRLTTISYELREIEPLIGAIATELSEYEMGRIAPAPVLQEQLWTQLQHAYQKRAKLESEFETLREGDERGKLALWRAQG
jgi:hypothetical protein